MNGGFFIFPPLFVSESLSGKEQYRRNGVYLCKSDLGEGEVLRKKLWCGICFLALAALVFVPMAPAAEVRELSLGEALALGLESNFAIKKAKFNWENASITYEKSKAANLLTASRVNELQLELNLLQAEANFLQTKDQALLTIVRQYLEVLKTRQERAWKRKKVEWAATTLEQMQKQVDQGYETRLTLMRQENEYHSTRLELKTLEDNYEQLGRELMVAIGQPMVGLADLALKPVSISLTWELNEEECQALARNHSRALQSITLEEEIARITLEKAIIDSVLPVEVQELENKLTLTTIRRQEAAWELENSVRKQYAALKQLTEEIALNEVHLVTVRENFQKIKQQQKVGLLKPVDYLAAEAELLQAEYQMQAAVGNFQLRKGEFQQLLGMDLEV